MRRSQAAALIAIAFAAAAGAWVDQDKSKEEAFIGNRRNWWAYQKPVRPSVPLSKDPWVRTPVDAFLLAALNAKQLKPSAPIDKEHLLRRVTLDLTGLPPTPAEVDSFIADKSPGAYEK